MTYLCPFFSTITDCQQYRTLQLTETLPILHNSYMTTKIILHTNSSLRISSNDTNDLTQLMWYLPNKHPRHVRIMLLILWFGIILQLNNFCVTERRTEKIWLKCNRYGLGQAVVMKVLKTGLSVQRYYLFVDFFYNGLLDIHSTQTCHVHNTNHSLK